MFKKTTAAQGTGAVLYHDRSGGVSAGLSDSVYGNYFKEAFQVTTTQRAFIEIPREMPGLLCALVIAWLSAWGDARSSVVAQLCSFVGLFALAVLAPDLRRDAILPVHQLHGDAPGYAAERFHWYEHCRTRIKSAAGWGNMPA